MNSKRQEDIIELMKDGYELRYQDFFPKSGSWYIHKNIGNGYIKSERVLKSTAKNMIAEGLIKFSHKDGYGHSHFVLIETNTLEKIEG